MSSRVVSRREEPSGILAILCHDLSQRATYCDTNKYGTVTRVHNHYQPDTKANPNPNHNPSKQHAI